MLIIGHRGAAGLAPENTLDAFQAGIESGADILEFDVQRTRDGELLVVHDTSLFRTHSKRTIIRWSSHESIKRATEKGHQIATLKEVMDTYFGVIFLNLEIKNHHVARYVIPFINEHYISTPEDWDAILISSFKPTELVAARRLNPDVSLALVHDKNPFTFMAFHRRVRFSAVGFHRLRINPLALEVAKQLGLFTYTYTINRTDAAKRARALGIDGIVTDNPLSIHQALK